MGAMGSGELVDQARSSDWCSERAGEISFDVGGLKPSSGRHDRVAIDANDSGEVRLEVEIAGLGCAAGIVARDGWLGKLEIWEPVKIQRTLPDAEASSDERFRADRLKGVAAALEPLSDVVRITWIACYNDGVLVSILGEPDETTGNADDARRPAAISLTDSKGTDYRPVELVGTYHHGESIRQCVGFSPGIPGDVSALSIQGGDGSELLVSLIQ
jgi:hypothetical protein